MISKEEMLDLFHKSFDERLIKDVAMHIQDGYADAIERSMGIDHEFQRHAIPQARHYIIQTRIKHVAKRHKGIKVGTEFSPTGTEPYSMLKVDNFTLTISMVKTPGNLPRYADFRWANALLNDHLFSAYDPVGDDRYNAILVHVPTYDNRNPAHMEVLFPNSDYTRSIHSIDLRSLIDFELEQPNVPQETIDSPTPKLRKRLPKKGAM